MFFESCLQASLRIFPSPKAFTYGESYNTTTRISLGLVLRSFESQSLYRYRGWSSKIFQVPDPLWRRGGGEARNFSKSQVLHIGRKVYMTTCTFRSSNSQNRMYFFISSTYSHIFLHVFHIFRHISSYFPHISSYSFIFSTCILSKSQGGWDVFTKLHTPYL